MWHVLIGPVGQGENEPDILAVGSLGPGGQPRGATQAALPPRLAPVGGGQQGEANEEEGEWWEEVKRFLSS